MKKKVRLLSREQLRALADTGLHDFVRHKVAKETAELTDRVAGVYQDDEEVPIADLQRMVATGLQAMPDLADELEDQVASGGLTLTKSELWEALALWVVENQLDEAPVWDSTRRPQRRKRLLSRPRWLGGGDG